MLITNFNLLQNKKIPDNKKEEFIIEINNNNMDLDIEEEKILLKNRFILNINN